ncbi:hypothetical protein [Isoptericola sp. NPDC057391]|uniref:hypothetical protein n=1 Tax=Isoptericola sp. NPDC057391 TaxID=3346117 RepID=UPI00364228CE
MKPVEEVVLTRERVVNARGLLATLGVLALGAGVAFLVFGPFRGGLGGDLVWPRPSIAFGTLDGHDVAVVAYDTLGESEVAAYDTATGERLWRRAAGWRPRPLGAGDEHVVVWDDQRLRVLDLRHGSVVAEGDDVAGLDLPHGELNWWQDGDAVDPTEGVVYVSVHDGFPEERPDLVRAVPLDGTTAAPLTPRQAERWGCYVGSADAASDPSVEPATGVTLGGVTYELLAPVGRPAGTPQRQLRVDGEPRGAVYPLGVHRAGVLTSSASGLVVPDVCDVGRPRSAATPLAPGSGVIAALVGADVEDPSSRLVLLDAGTGAERHRVERVVEVAVARTTPSGGAVIVVETRQPGLLGLMARTDARLVLISPDGAVTETVV